MKSIFILALFSLIVPITFGLKCKFLTVDLGPEGAVEPPPAKEGQKEYECPKEDKNCVLLEGVLDSSPNNLTFSIRSCESDVKRYMEPISAKMGQELEYECEKMDGKNHTVGPVSYWYNCCKTDGCNSGAFQAFGPFSVFAAVALCLLISISTTKIH